MNSNQRRSAYAKLLFCKVTVRSSGNPASMPHVYVSNSDVRPLPLRFKVRRSAKCRKAERAAARGVNGWGN